MKYRWQHLRLAYGDIRALCLFNRETICCCFFLLIIVFSEWRKNQLNESLKKWRTVLNSPSVFRTLHLLMLYKMGKPLSTKAWENFYLAPKSNVLHVKLLHCLHYCKYETKSTDILLPFRTLLEVYENVNLLMKKAGFPFSSMDATSHSRQYQHVNKTFHMTAEADRCDWACGCCARFLFISPSWWVEENSLPAPRLNGPFIESRVI